MHQHLRCLLLCGVLASADPDGCEADYGTPLDGPVCCGQPGRVKQQASICPKDLPKCVGYEYHRYGKHMGTCISDKPTPPVKPTPGYWTLRGKQCSSPNKNMTTTKCASGASSESKLAACCSADPSCGGFSWYGTAGTVYGVDCPITIGAGADGGGLLFVKSDVPQGGGALPTKAQLDWHEREMGAFVSWTIEEHCGPVGTGEKDYPNCWKHTPGTCTSQPDCGDCPDPDKFVISEERFTDQWAQSMHSLGVTYAVMVLKQHCGWAMWPSNVSLPDGSVYSYGVASSPSKRNIAAEFASSCRKFNITPGFYMLMGSNAFLGVINNRLTNNPHVQHKVSLDEYNAVCLNQLTELWSGFGPLAEVSE